MAVTATELNPELAAQEANLRYMCDDRPGYTRRRHGKGFIYLDPRGKLVTDASVKAWLRSLVIPPAWQEVWISPFRNGHLLATGRDEKGRKQYIYHPRWTECRAETNFHRLLAFGEALPALRARIDADLRRHGLPRERVLALVVHLLESTLIRVGNPQYARDNRSYGLTTLRRRHLDVDGTRLHFEFRGKSGKNHVVDLQDRRAARIIRACQELPGQELFQYLDERGARHCIDSADVNEYLSASGENFTAKAFRTWGGSAAMVGMLMELPPPANKKETRHNLRLALRTTAERLRNTQAVCRRHYVHPLIERRYEDASFFEICHSGQCAEPALNEEEQALMNLLYAEAQAVGTGSK